MRQLQILRPTVMCFQVSDSPSVPSFPPTLPHVLPLVLHALLLTGFLSHRFDAQEWEDDGDSGKCFRTQVTDAMHLHLGNARNSAAHDNTNRWSRWWIG